MDRECKTHPSGRLLGALVFVAALWSAAVGADPLAGRIWAPDQQRFVEPATVFEAVRSAEIVLLGETHTIERHHALQARLLRAAARDRRPTVVFEMVRRDQQPAIDRWRDADAPDPDAFGPAVDWTGRGWPAWSMYRPIVATALELGLPIRGGAPAEATLHRVARAGLDGLEPARRSALGLDQDLPAAARDRLAHTLERAHCGLPESAPVDRMIAVQRLRDAAMAARLRAADGGAVLIAGHGHVRTDYGVPLYLQQHVDAGAVVSIAFMGSDGLESPADRGDDRAALPYDYVWYTEGGVDTPACAEGD